MSCRRRDGAGQSGSFASGQLCLGKGAGGCELQRKARCPAGARALKNEGPQRRPEKNQLDIFSKKFIMEL